MTHNPILALLVAGSLNHY